MKSMYDRLADPGGSAIRVFMTGLDCISALKALGEETRLRILRLLFKKPLGVNEPGLRCFASTVSVAHQACLPLPA